MYKRQPQVIENTFSTIFPYVYALILFYALSVISQLAFGKLLPELWQYIFTLITVAVENPVAVTVLTAFENLLFSFGIHPTTVVGPLLDPLQLVTLTANAEAFAAGTAPVSYTHLDVYKRQEHTDSILHPIPGSHFYSLHRDSDSFSDIL